ncbi:MAG: T9SS type A sorting domain-containing protein [Gammaproteobacteria bacterium]|nr:T9SS type A sorting domain-containing protein [Gammaproteobacteria bacterium]
MAIAQTTFTVDAPAAIAGEYDAIRGLWGQHADGTMLTGEIVLAEDGQAIPDQNGFPGSVNDGCEALTNDVAGKIVLVDRVFTCNAIDAMANAAGAIGMLVCANNLDDNYANPVAPRGAGLDLATGMQAYSDIPAFALSLEACQNIKMQLSNGETVSGSYNVACTAVEPENAVWGTTLASPEGWEIEGGGWAYEEDLYVARGAYNSALGYARTTTACDGGFVFDSDFLDNQGIAGNFGFGDCPADCSSTLTSPTIDLSSSTATGFTLVFDQALRQFNSSYYVIISGDDGMTWDTIQINDEYPTNSPHIAETRNVSLCGIKSDSQLKLRFWMNGNYYYWGIDDMYIVEDETIDVQANENFYATAPNYRTPVSQLDYHAFLVDVENYGNSDADDVVVTAAITDSNGEQLFETGRDYGTIPFCFLDENKVMDGTFDMSGLDIGTYSTNYSVASPNNTTPVGDALTSSWEITDDVFAKVLPESEAGVAYLGNFGAATLNYISHGNAYYVANPGYGAVSVRTGIAPQAAGESFIGEVLVELFEWFDDNGDGIAQNDEREVVAEGFIELANDDPEVGDAEIMLESTTGDDDITLNAGSMYLAMAHISALDPVDYALRFKAAAVDDDRSFDFNAMRLATDEIGMPRYGTMIDFGASFDDIENREFGPVSNLTSYLPLTIKQLPVGTEDINEKIGVSIYPNPVVDFINIDLDLEATSERVNVTLTNAAGQIAHTQNWKNVNNQTLRISTADLTPGSYVANIRTDAGFTSKKIMVIK